MISILLFFRLFLPFTHTDLMEPKEHYYIQFERIDNRADILVNDSLVYSSGTIDFNPELNELHSIYLGNFLTSELDKVVVRIYNGHEPYLDEDDKHWEIKYVLLENEDLVDYVWEYEDDGTIGVVFEMIHYL